MTHVDLEVQGSLKVATSAYKEMAVDIRKCYFTDEGDLKIFEMYTQFNCELEWLWTKAYKMCGCKPWDIPALGI